MPLAVDGQADSWRNPVLNHSSTLNECNRDVSSIETIRLSVGGSENFLRAD